MQRLAGGEIVHDEIAHLFDQSWNEVGLWRDVFALTDFHISRTKISSVMAKSFKSDPMKIEDGRRSQSERLVIANHLIDQVKHAIKLRKCVF